MSLVKNNKVFITPTKKLFYTTSPLKRIYGPDGLTTSVLQRHNISRREKLLAAYRNVVRLVKYIQIHNHFRQILVVLAKIRLRQDYKYRRSTFLNTPYNESDFDVRLVNTVNFIHNASLDNPYNETSRPSSLEFKIINSLVQFENTKALPGPLRGRLKSEFVAIEKWRELRGIERAWNMSNADEKTKDERMWWLEGQKLRNDVCFDYLKELQLIEKKTFLDHMVTSMIEYERAIVLLNEECHLFL